MKLSANLILFCMTSLFSPLWGQASWTPSGSSILSTPTGVNVGIGTPGPVAPLQVVGNSELFGSANKIYGNSDATNYYFGHYPVANTDGLDVHWFGGVRLGTAAGPVIQVTQGGNVGVGTTTPATLLHIYNATTFNPSSNATPTVLAEGAYGGGVLLKDGAGYLGMWSTGAGTQLNFKTGGTSSGFGGPYGSMVLDNNGNLGLGTLPGSAYRLSVNGPIRAKEVIVETGWSDYVLRPDYRLQPLREVAAYIREQGHLPEIPTEKEVKEHGVSLGDMQSKLLAKVEELTLHMIQADERNTRLEQQNRDLQERLARLEGQPKPQSPKAQ